MEMEARFNPSHCLPEAKARPDVERAAQERLVADAVDGLLDHLSVSDGRVVYAPPGQEPRSVTVGPVPRWLSRAVGSLSSAEFKTHPLRLTLLEIIADQAQRQKNGALEYAPRQFLNATPRQAREERNRLEQRAKAFDRKSAEKGDETSPLELDPRVRLDPGPVLEKVRTSVAAQRQKEVVRQATAVPKPERPDESVAVVSPAPAERAPRPSEPPPSPRPPEPEDPRRVRREALRSAAEFYASYAESVLPQQDVASFRHLPSELRDAHRAYVDEIERKFDPPPTTDGVDYGRLLENFMAAELSRQADWFGGAFVRSTKYDDYANGVDGIFEWTSRNGREAYRLAVDFTVAENEETLRHKLAKVETGVRVTYFRSPNFRRPDGTQHEVRLYAQPMVVLGVDRETLKQAVLETNGDPAALREHPIRTLLLRQALRQVELQVRALAARAYVNASGRQNQIPEALYRAVSAYADRLRKNPAFTRDAGEVAKIFWNLSRDHIDAALFDRDESNRFYQLLGVQANLRERLRAAESESSSDLDAIRPSRQSALGGVPADSHQAV